MATAHLILGPERRFYFIFFKKKKKKKKKNNIKKNQKHPKTMKTVAHLIDQSLCELRIPIFKPVHYGAGYRKHVNLAQSGRAHPTFSLLITILFFF
jgi:hypothetical protein